MKAKYRVHRLEIRMTADQSKLEQFLNSLDGEVVAIIPNITPKFTPGGMGAEVDFLLVVERMK
jgi:gamma-glutamyl phosphate reductase